MLAEVISALMIAIFFDPLKERIQRFVWRFFRTEESSALAQSEKAGST